MVMIASLLCGLLFGAGLLISGMVQPTKVLGFLDVTDELTLTARATKTQGASRSQAATPDFLSGSPARARPP
jgi:hypothetical protein